MHVNKPQSCTSDQLTSVRMWVSDRAPEREGEGVEGEEGTRERKRGERGNKNGQDKEKRNEEVERTRVEYSCCLRCFECAESKVVSSLTLAL